MFGLSLADLTVLLIYLLGTTALGLWVGRRSRTVAEYFMPRKFSKPVMIMYAFGTGTASDQAVLVAAATFKNGLSGIWYQWLWLFATPFYWIIAPIMRRFRAITTADVYELRYDLGVARLFAAFGIASLSVKTGLLLKGSAVRAPEIYEPWRIIAYMSAGVAAGVGVSLVTRRVDPEKLERFYALVRTPARPGERVETPCTLPPGAVVPRRRMLLTSFELEVPMPSRTSLLGFAAGWVMVGLLLGGFAWYVGG